MAVFTKFKARISRSFFPKLETPAEAKVSCKEASYLGVFGLLATVGFKEMGSYILGKPGLTVNEWVNLVALLIVSGFIFFKQSRTGAILLFVFYSIGFVTALFERAFILSGIIVSISFAWVFWNGVRASFRYHQFQREVNQPNNSATIKYSRWKDIIFLSLRVSSILLAVGLVTNIVEWKLFDVEQEEARKAINISVAHDNNGLCPSDYPLVIVIENSFHKTIKLANFSIEATLQGENRSLSLADKYYTWEDPIAPGRSKGKCFNLPFEPQDINPIQVSYRAGTEGEGLGFIFYEKGETVPVDLDSDEHLDKDNGN